MNNPISDKTNSEITSLLVFGGATWHDSQLSQHKWGTVSNYISKWKNEIGVPNAEAVRDFCVLAKGQNVTPLQCAEGFRILDVLRNCGISNQFTGFVVKFYDLRKSFVEEPNRIFSVCRQILELDESVPLAQLTESISKLVERKRILRNENAILKQSKEGLQEECSKLFDEKNVTQFDLGKYKKTERETQKIWFIPSWPGENR